MTPDHGLSSTARPIRDLAIIGLMLEVGLSARNIADLMLAQLRPDNPDQLREKTGAYLMYGRASKRVLLSPDARRIIALYLTQERPLDADSSSRALFLAAKDQYPPNSMSHPLSEKSIEAIIGGEGNLREVSVAPGSAIPADILEQVSAVAMAWARAHGCPRPQSMAIVSTTYDRAVPSLHGAPIKGWPPRGIYLVVLEGYFTLHEALKSGVSSASAGRWAALVIYQSPPLRVGPIVLRPDQPDEFSLNDLGPVQSVEFPD